MPSRGSSTTRTFPPKPLATSPLRSVDALSTTTSSSTGRVCARTLSIASARWRSPSWTTIRAEIEGSGKAGHQVGDGVGVGHRVLAEEELEAGQPPNQPSQRREGLPPLDAGLKD